MPITDCLLTMRRVQREHVRVGRVCEGWRARKGCYPAAGMSSSDRQAPMSSSNRQAHPSLHTLNISLSSSLRPLSPQNTVLCEEGRRGGPPHRPRHLREGTQPSRDLRAPTISRRQLLHKPHRHSTLRLAVRQGGPCLVNLRKVGRTQLEWRRRQG